MYVYACRKHLQTQRLHKRLNVSFLALLVLVDIVIFIIKVK